MNIYSPAPNSRATFLKSDRFLKLLLFAIVLIAYGNILTGSSFIRDDQYIIAMNPLLTSWRSIPKLLTTGYWESALGAEAPVQEFRPLLMLSYSITALFFGMRPWIFHLSNVLLHAANALLLFALLRIRHPKKTALGAAALFAVLPVHVEAVSYVSGRSELLAAFFILLTWIELVRDRPRLILSFFWFLCALFCKEQAVLFPAIFFLYDWATDKTLPAARNRVRIYQGLLLCTAVYLAVRLLVLSNPFHGGHDYFMGRPYIVRILTMSQFALRHYLWPSLTGWGMRSEFVRPSFPDASPSDFQSWIPVLAWILFFGGAFFVLFRRRDMRAFWISAGLIWLLPVSNLLIPLDTIGAERFLYIPTIGICLLVAQLLLEEKSPRRRLGAAAFGLLLVWYGARTFLRNKTWQSEIAYYRQAVLDNPLAAGSQSGLGVALLEEGKQAEAENAFKKALEINPNHPTAYYNLGKLYFEKEHWLRSKDFFLKCLSLAPNNVDSWLFLGVIEERLHHLPQAAANYDKALLLQPWNAIAHFNQGRIRLLLGQSAEARRQFTDFLRLAPNDSSAEEVRRMLAQMEVRNPTRRQEGRLLNDQNPL